MIEWRLRLQTCARSKFGCIGASVRRCAGRTFRAQGAVADLYEFQVQLYRSKRATVRGAHLPSQGAVAELCDNG